MTEDKIFFVLENINKNLDDGRKSRSKIHKKISIVSETIIGFKEKITIVQKDVEVLQKNVRKNTDIISKRETQLKMLAVIIQKVAPNLPRILRIIAYLIGASLFINWSVLLMKALKIWNVF